VDAFCGGVFEVGAKPRVVLGGVEGGHDKKKLSKGNPSKG
jgi:hypothetical protein